MWMLRLTKFAVYSNAMLLQVLWYRVFTCYFNQISPPFLYLTTILTKLQRKFNKVPTFFTPKCDRTNFCKCWLEFNQVYYIEHWFWYRLLYCHKYDKNLQKYNFKYISMNKMTLMKIALVIVGSNGNKNLKISRLLSSIK